MDKTEAETIEKFLRFCKFGIIALLVAGGTMNSSILLGMV